MPKPIIPPGEPEKPKDPKQDKRYLVGSCFKALYEPKAIPALLDTPEKALAAREIHKRMISDYRKKRNADPRNKNAKQVKNNAG